MNLVMLSAYQGSILGPIAKLLGKILEGLYFVLSKVGIENTAVCIILFTFIINALMIPLQFKQQKFSRMSSIMNPEIQKIQEKYKNKKDEESQKLMNYEMQALYSKYGVSPASGCLPLLISLPIMFALYRVIYNIPAYVPQIYDIYAQLGKNIMEAGASVEDLKEYISSNTYVVTNAIKGAAKDATNLDYYIDMLSQFTTEGFKKLSADYPECASIIDVVSTKAKHVNSFFGLNIADTPKLKSVSVVIPIVSVITQFISTKISMAGTNNNNTDSSNPTQQSMKAMNNFMPLMSGAFCFMFPIGVGIYWIAGNVFRIFQSLFINLYFSKQDLTENMSKNVEKSKKRFKMMGLDDKQIEEIHSENKGTSNSKSGKVNVGEVKEGSSKLKKYAKVGSDNNEDKTSVKDVINKKIVPEVEDNVNKENLQKGSVSSYAHMLKRD
ncbi:MAG: YidC/Oxa1 family membrane protein insertase [Lachnospiraceae bacterium]|nr:YidC/Oxa1 family membrane protein insertase [Lachnospiraceae bacterium]